MRNDEEKTYAIVLQLNLLTLSSLQNFERNKSNQNTTKERKKVRYKNKNCVCVFLCERDSESERERVRERESDRKRLREEGIIRRDEQGKGRNIIVQD